MSVVLQGLWLESESPDDSDSLDCCRWSFRREVVVMKNSWKLDSVDESSSSSLEQRLLVVLVFELLELLELVLL